MPSTREICYYAMYVIGEVESNWEWTAVYYRDPITIGMMQWYGTRAAALLGRVRDETPEAYGQLAQSLRDALAAHPSTDVWWNRQYLTQAEGNSIVTVFSARENHVIQENQAIADFEGYISTLEGWGMSQANPKPLIFAMAAYHQSPKRAGIIMGTAGGNADLERLYTLTLNDGVLGQYRNRYTTVYNRLKAWDGESAPPDFGQVGDVSVGGNSPGISRDPNALCYIIRQGDTLVLYGQGEEYRNGIVFYPASGQRWVAGFNAFGSPIEGGNTGGGSETDSDARAAVVELYTSWVGRFKYSQGPGRLNPIASGYGDCSSTIWYAYQQVTGLNVGTWTGDMVERGTLIASGSGALPLSSMQPADLVLFNRGDYNPTFDHVELYVGDGRLCGHGSSQGPTIKDDANAYAMRAHDWQVRRYL